MPLGESKKSVADWQFNMCSCFKTRSPGNTDNRGELFEKGLYRPPAAGGCT